MPTVIDDRWFHRQKVLAAGVIKELHSLYASPIAVARGGELHNQDVY